MIDAILLFSGGKDSVLALAALRTDPAVRSITLLATLIESDETVAGHGVPRRLLEAQAASLGYPIRFASVPRLPANSLYESRMVAVIDPLRGRSGTCLVAGDLHLADIRAWREAWAERCGLPIRFPLWGRAPESLAWAFVADGYRATLVCVDANRLDTRWAGAPFDSTFLEALPPGVDPCGENGEFHTFVSDGPIFTFPVPMVAGTPRIEHAHGFVPLTLGATSSCTECGAPFTCAATTPAVECWCVRLPSTTPDPLASGCLCPRCLAERVAG